MHRSLLPSRSSTTAGFSLVEVVMAVIVLGLAGAAILNALTSTVLRNEKVNDRTQRLLALSAAADIMTSATWKPCYLGTTVSPVDVRTESKSQPYSAVTLPDGVILKVMGLDSGVRKYCDGSSGTSPTTVEVLLVDTLSSQQKRIVKSSPDGAVGAVPAAAYAVCLDVGCSPSMTITLSPNGSSTLPLSIQTGGTYTSPLQFAVQAVTTPSPIDVETIPVSDTTATLAFSVQNSAAAGDYLFNVFCIDGKGSVTETRTITIRVS